MRTFACGFLVLCLCCCCIPTLAQKPALQVNNDGYLEMPGLNAMAFQDIYPEGHQGGVRIIQNGVRVATNGDLRLDPTPGQWQSMPKQDKRVANQQSNEITAWLSYPDPSRNRTGFNPIDDPELNLSYQVHARGEGQNIRIVVDLDHPLPAQFVGKVGFNFELYPTALFGKGWYLGKQSGIFPRQPAGPDLKDASGDVEPVPLWHRESMCWERVFELHVSGTGSGSGAQREIDCVCRGSADEEASQ